MEQRPYNRRAFLQTAGILGLAPFFPPVPPFAAAGQPSYVLGPNEGEHLVHFRDGGDLCIKLSRLTTGSDAFAVGTQQVRVGTGIPEHRHPAAEETFYLLEGAGSVLLDGQWHAIEAGTWIYIPRGTWHAFKNPQEELKLLWTVSPAGLEAFFRETCSPPGAPPKNLTRDEIRAIALRHGTEFR